VNSLTCRPLIGVLARRVMGIRRRRQGMVEQGQRIAKREGGYCCFVRGALCEEGEGCREQVC
jgi:hypothetical protein